MYARSGFEQQNGGEDGGKKEEWRIKEDKGEENRWERGKAAKDARISGGRREENKEEWGLTGAKGGSRLLWALRRGAGLEEHEERWDSEALSRPEEGVKS